MSMSCLDAVERVLREAGEPLRYKEITKRVLAEKLWITSGKTPAATINARLCDDLNRHGEDSRFARRAPGVFGLRDAGSPSTASRNPRLAPASSESIRSRRKGLTDLEKEIEKVRSSYKEDMKGMNESKTRSFLVEPILKCLGWDSPKVMEPEYPVGGRQRDKVDIALLLDGEIKVMVEVKRDKLEGHEKQLLEYCRLEDVPLGVLTNGRVWKLYYEMDKKKGDYSAEDYLAEIIDIKEDDACAVANRMGGFLGLENVGKGKAEAAFKSAWKQRAKGPKWDRVMQERWNEVLSGFAPQLTKALREAVRLSGEAIAEDAVRKFVRKKIFSQKQAALDTERKTIEGSTLGVRVASKRESANDLTSLQRLARGTRPNLIEVFGKQFEVESWRQAVQVFLGEVYKRKPEELRHLAERRRVFAISAGKPAADFKVPLRIGNSDIWVKGHGSGETHKKLCESVCKALNFPQSVIRYLSMV